MTRRKLILLLSLFAFGPRILATLADSNSYTRRVLGRWLGPRKYVWFHRDGSWGVQRNEDAPVDIDGRRWRIEDGKLKLEFPGGEHSATIVEFSNDKFITKQDGITTVYERVPGANV